MPRGSAKQRAAKHRLVSCSDNGRFGPIVDSVFCSCFVNDECNNNENDNGIEDEETARNGGAEDWDDEEIVDINAFVELDDCDDWGGEINNNDSDDDDEYSFKEFSVN